MNHGRVLVVEDDPSIRMLIRMVLEARGLEVAQAEDGSSAHPLARAFRPDLVLLDVGLPGIDGLAVLELLKDDAELRDVPVVMVTAWAEADVMATAVARGAHGYLRKPFEIDDLCRCVDDALSAPPTALAA
jgi:CheY-like chemotaxis protein